jgi:hypothetical protein
MSRPGTSKYTAELASGFIQFSSCFGIQALTNDRIPTRINVIKRLRRIDNFTPGKSAVSSSESPGVLEEGRVKEIDRAKVHAIFTLRNQCA